MGLFGKIFGGGEKEYPALDPASSDSAQIEKFKPQLETLFKKIDDRYELLPGDEATYVFLGKPPGMFGLAWFIQGDSSEHNFKTLMAKKGLTQRKIDNILGKLRTAYTENSNEPRFSVTVAGKKAIVTPSDTFHSIVHNIVHFLDEAK